MEVADVRKRLLAVIDAARRAAAARRTRVDEAAREFPRFLSGVAVPLFRQVAAVLRAEGLTFSVHTPSGSVRLMSDRNPDHFIELVLDTSSSEPLVMGRVRYAQGSRVVESEQAIGSGLIQEVTETQVLEFLAGSLGPFVAR